MSQYATPGVYVKERNAFGSTVVAVPTAVPAFIGYTEKAMRGRNSLLHKPTRITSLAEYVALFGGAPNTTFNIKAKGADDFELRVDKNTKYNLFRSVQLFYANGGGTCYVIAVGNYNAPMNAKDFNMPEINGGLAALAAETEPTIICIPDATLLERGDCYGLYQEVLRHCGQTKTTFAVLDVYDGYKERTFDENDVVTQFRNGVGSNFLAFGAGYYPWVKTTVVSGAEVSYKNISNANDLVKILVREAEATFLGTASEAPAEAPAAPGPDDKPGDDKGKKPAAPPASRASNVDPKMLEKFEQVKSEIEKLKNPSADASAVDQTLKALSPAYKQILVSMREEMNLMPPSAMLAGIYSLVDNTVGVYKAPANISLSGVVAPAVNITHQGQEDLNMPINGKAVNAIRGFVGKGVVVWGARTLDGNSQDWKYINVRRSMTMLEQSIKAACEAYVFEPNDSKTWLKVRSSIVNFLTTQWKNGVLVGSTTGDAYNVDLGLGLTMTPEDVLDGIMRVNVKVAISRPAEFIELNFEQKMMASGGDASMN
ncbi:MAG: phage tail sheath family protein [Saprospiraceae bacterium]|nr:phage tail sheath family protein [Saprospiraceae bacterium]